MEKCEGKSKDICVLQLFNDKLLNKTSLRSRWATSGWTRARVASVCGLRAALEALTDRLVVDGVMAMHLLSVLEEAAIETPNQKTASAGYILSTFS